MQQIFKNLLAVMCSAALFGCAGENTPRIAEFEGAALPAGSPLSKQGAYGIGEGWTVDLQPAEYDYVSETIVIGGMAPKLIVVPAKTKWVKGDGAGLKVFTGPRFKTVEIPAVYTDIEEMVVTEIGKTEYHISEPVYNSDGSLKSPAEIEARYIPAKTKQVPRRVIETPVRYERREIPPETRRGYTLVITEPATTMTDPNEPATRQYTTRKKVIKTPWRFVVRDPQGRIAHTFDSYEDFSAFKNNLK